MLGKLIPHFGIFLTPLEHGEKSKVLVILEKMSRLTEISEYPSVIWRRTFQLNGINIERVNFSSLS